jgi:hypothetical protein
MTSRNAKRLEAVADALLCAKCGERPRFVSLSRCRQCLAADTARELAGYDRLRAAKSNHQQAAGSRAAGRKGKAAPVPAVKAVVVPVRPAGQAIKPLVQTEPTRKPVEPAPTAEQWTLWITEWAKRNRQANDPAVERRIAERDIGADLVQQHAGHYTATFGANPHLRLFALNNASLEVVLQTFKRMYPELEQTMDERNGKVTMAPDRKVLCRFCQARVLEPCTPSRSTSCRNRSRANR